MDYSVHLRRIVVTLIAGVFNCTSAGQSNTFHTEFTVMKLPSVAASSVRRSQMLGIDAVPVTTISFVIVVCSLLLESVFNVLDLGHRNPTYCALTSMRVSTVFNVFGVGCASVNSASVSVS